MVNSEKKIKLSQFLAYCIHTLIASSVKAQTFCAFKPSSSFEAFIPTNTDIADHPGFNSGKNYR